MYRNEYKKDTVMMAVSFLYVEYPSNAVI